MSVVSQESQISSAEDLAQKLNSVDGVSSFVINVLVEPKQDQ